MKIKFLYSVLVAFALFVASCGKQPEAQINVMTFNIRLDHVSDSLNNWKYRKDNAAKMLSYYAPDILGMQEVVKNQLDDLKDRLPQYTALGVGRADGKEKGEFCPIFYKTDRFELVDYGNFGMSENPDSIGLKGWDAGCERITTWAVLKDKDSGKKIAAFNTHFDHIGKIARKESAILILSKMEKIANGLPIILTGDFNGTINSEPIEILMNNGMKNTYKEANITYGPSWSFHAFGKIPLNERNLIDYILVRGSFEIAKCRIVGDKPDEGFLSDHTPVITTLNLK